MTQATDQSMLYQIKEVARRCGEIAYGIRMNPANVNTQIKADSSLVTVADTTLEAAIKKQLVGLFGGSFVGEETATTKAEFNPEYEWVVDPIDGTTNFSRGTAENGYPNLPTWGISIGLKKDGKPHIGVIYQPQTDELYYAVAGQGAFVETTKFGIQYQRKLQLAEKYTDNRALFGLGIVARTTMTPTHLEIYQGFEEVAKGKVDSSTSRCLGAAGMEALCVACGTYAAYAGIVAEHDIAAARVILAEAGARISTFPTGAAQGNRFCFVASHPEIHEALVAKVKTAVMPTAEISGDLTAKSDNRLTQQPT